MDDKCPKCGASHYSIAGSVTLMNGPNNITTYHCTNCGHSWTSKPDANIGVASAAPPRYAVPCLLCGEPIVLDYYVHTIRPAICDCCKALWKQIIKEREKTR